MSNGPRYRGKTFHEYMSAKFWHPASKRNIVTVWKRKQQMEVITNIQLINYRGYAILPLFVVKFRRNMTKIG